MFQRDVWGQRSSICERGNNLYLLLGRPASLVSSAIIAVIPCKAICIQFILHTCHYWLHSHHHHPWNQITSMQNFIVLYSLPIITILQQMFLLVHQKFLQLISFNSFTSAPPCSQIALLNEKCSSKQSLVTFFGRLVCAACGLLPILVFLAMLGLPETPPWLVLQVGLIWSWQP